jgi:hypothetical protein
MCIIPKIAVEVNLVRDIEVILQWGVELMMLRYTEVFLLTCRNYYLVIYRISSVVHCGD